MKRFNLIKNEDGAVMPLVALVLSIVILGFAALVIDVGILYAERRTMVTAADAAALAGAMEMKDALGNSEYGKNAAYEAEKVAKRIAMANGVKDDEDIKVIIGQNPDFGRETITVKVHNNKKLIFAKFLGFDNTDVGAKSVATWGYMMGNVVPLFAVEESLEGNALSQKHLGIGAGGNWGFLLDENNKKYETQDLIHFLTGEKALKRKFVVGEKLGGTSTGIEKQATVPGIEGRMKNARKLDISKRKDMMTVIIPVLKLDKSGGNSPATILYFISALIEDVVDKDGIGSKYALGENFDRKENHSKLDWTHIGLPNNAEGTIIVKFGSEKIYDLDEVSTQGGQIGSGNSKYQKLIK